MTDKFHAPAGVEGAHQPQEKAENLSRMDTPGSPVDSLTASSADADSWRAAFFRLGHVLNIECREHGDIVEALGVELDPSSMESDETFHARVLAEIKRLQKLHQASVEGAEPPQPEPFLLTLESGFQMPARTITRLHGFTRTEFQIVNAEGSFQVPASTINMITLTSGAEGAGHQPAQAADDALCGCGYKQSLHRVDSNEGGVYCQIARLRHGLLSQRLYSADIIALMNERNGLKTERDEARLAHECSEAVLSMAVARLGGEVEGRPTHRVNFLQRIDALIAVEGAGHPQPPKTELERRDQIALSTLKAIYGSDWVPTSRQLHAMVNAFSDVMQLGAVGGAPPQTHTEKD